MSVLDRFRLDGTTALVVGAGPGIGRQVAKAYAELGANVVVSARNGDRMEALAAEIRTAGGEAIGVANDVADPGAADQLVERANAAYGPVHILFFNAYFARPPGRPQPSDALEVDEAWWRQAFEVNLLAPFRLARRLAPDMRAEGYGSIINLLTCAAFTPLASSIAYGSTKAGLHMMTRYLAKACGPRVRANCICPGTISPDGAVTPIAGEHLAKNAIARMGSADEVVGAAVLLASPASSYTTGQVIFCEGGRIGTLS